MTYTELTDGLPHHDGPISRIIRSRFEVFRKITKLGLLELRVQDHKRIREWLKPIR